MQWIAEQLAFKFCPQFYRILFCFEFLEIRNVVVDYSEDDILVLANGCSRMTRMLRKVVCSLSRDVFFAKVAETEVWDGEISSDDSGHPERTKDLKQEAKEYKRWWVVTSRVTVRLQYQGETVVRKQKGFSNSKNESRHRDLHFVGSYRR